MVSDRTIVGKVNHGISMLIGMGTVLFGLCIVVIWVWTIKLEASEAADSVKVNAKKIELHRTTCDDIDAKQTLSIELVKKDLSTIKETLDKLDVKVDVKMDKMLEALEKLAAKK